MAGFIEKIDELASHFNINQNSVVYKYIEKKTRASGRDSKARRSLGNLYALYVLCQAYNEGAKDGTSFSVLMQKMKALPFGAKLQNHPLDNRLNDEVRRSFQVQDSMLPVQNATEGTAKRRKISIDFLSEHEMDPGSASIFITKAIDLYIDEITEKQNEFLFNIESADGKDSILEFVENSFSPNADARLFEVVSFSVLKIYFSKKNVVINGKEEFFQLFKTGRTNANDGGIDFVLRPVGRFFQVTEVLDFKKYFLDFDKTNKFPMSFVVKTELDPEGVMSLIKINSEKNMGPESAQRYVRLFEEVFTLPTLRSIVGIISDSLEDLEELKRVIIENFKLEYGLLD
ncbi:type II restriction endonuclease [Cronobacter sakazakii]